MPLTRWSLDRLSAWLAEQGIRVSPTQLARLLAQAGLSFQRTRSWKASPDPDYETKAARVLELYVAAPFDGPVISFDQMGPISLKPIQGAGWAPRKRPERLRATYNRRFHGARRSEIDRVVQAGVHRDASTCPVGVWLTVGVDEARHLRDRITGEVAVREKF